MRKILTAALMLITLTGCQLSEEHLSTCRERASKEKNEYSAKQTYNHCKQTIKNERKNLAR